ncbi:Fic family protein [Schauerella aestuarii]|uniref:Fic family protein n=1 Tax=Schauerella aestuarii TaxID=2511204 RepID=UPI00136F20A7|nr:Fic family protein [Achromobacter aestuarii]MYZ44733.1 cell filamentation protein Fic [Achromobacter aestuarii]
MSEQKVGYAWIVENLRLKTTRSFLPAKVTASTRALHNLGDQLLVPPHIAPSDEDPISHLEFALKHQKVDLESIQAASLALDPAHVQARINERPSGLYLRQIGVLFEHFTGHSLDVSSPTAKYVDLFDDSYYICGVARRNAKYRVNVNGLGPLSYCPIVRRTPAITRLVARDLFADLDRFVESVGGTKHLDRALGWAYLDETRGSFQIERDPPSDDRARRFVQLLHQAHQGMPLTEAYLAELQSSIIRSPHHQEVAFRHQQNWLASASRSAAVNVTYIPPAPEPLEALMADFMAFANAPAQGDGNNALIKAMLVSFGFVFNHPFMDGNGRISRFLVHHSLCRAGVLQQGLILPISVAMQHHEGDYLSALKSVSAPIRDLWEVAVIDERALRTTFNGSADPYRYWDATATVEFGLQMAHYALDHSLLEESEFLKRFDIARKAVERSYDIQNRDVVNLVRMAYDTRGVLSKNRRKQFADRVEPEVLDAIERAVTAAFFPDIDIEPVAVTKPNADESTR